MRNWNHTYPPKIRKKIPNFYPTYEELKQQSDVSLFGVVIIFTLPMRNWNYSFLMRLVILLYLFLPYLWGIETFFVVSQIDVAACIFTLPMRNWNLSMLPVCQSVLANFYPTYEDEKTYKKSHQQGNLGRYKKTWQTLFLFLKFNQNYYHILASVEGV